MRGYIKYEKKGVRVLYVLCWEDDCDCVIDGIGGKLVDYLSLDFNLPASILS